MLSPTHATLTEALDSTAENKNNARYNRHVILIFLIASFKKKAGHTARSVVYVFGLADANLTNYFFARTNAVF